MSSTPNKQAGYPRLVADIGGTNARFALETAPRVIEKAAVLPCKDYDTVTDAVRAYLNQSGATAVRHAAFAIANPILGDWVQMTNHHWAFSIETTRQTLGLDTLILLNDFTAQALAVTQTSSKDLMQVGGQKPVEFAPQSRYRPRYRPGRERIGAQPRRLGGFGGRGRAYQFPAV
ncbi:glucokinase [Neisseria meningitidis]|nr:glucokinase [Neisseria meningitidis]